MRETLCFLGWYGYENVIDIKSMEEVKMSIKADAHDIIDALPEEAGWNDLVKQLYKEHKITYGMTDLEVVQPHLSDEDISAILGRLESSHTKLDDKRNTKTYNPDNKLTAAWVMVAFAPLLFISILLAPAAYIMSALGILIGLKALFSGLKSAWLPVVVGSIELILFVAVPVLGT